MVIGAWMAIGEWYRRKLRHGRGWEVLLGSRPTSWREVDI